MPGIGLEFQPFRLGGGGGGGGGGGKVSDVDIATNNQLHEWD